MTATTTKFQLAAVAAAVLASLQADAPTVPPLNLLTRTHHMTIKAAYRKVVGRALDQDGLAYADLTAAIAAVIQAAAKPARATKAPRTVRHVTLAELPKVGKWAKVVRIAAWGRKGQPKRVVIRCACGKEREIATQDLFQVRHCSLKCKQGEAKAADVEKTAVLMDRVRRTPAGRRKAA